jgi:hypothetical protein
MTTYTKMLEAEMQASQKFTAANFGLQMGDGYPELVREMLKSDTVTSRLLVTVIINSMVTKPFVQAVKARGVGRPLDNELAQLMMQHMDLFGPLLEMFYWGIQVGRKAQEEQVRYEREAARKEAAYRGEAQWPSK